MSSQKTIALERSGPAVSTLSDGTRGEPLHAENAGPWARRGMRGDADNAEQSAAAQPAPSPVADAVRRMLNRSGNSLFLAIEPLTEAEFFGAGANGISVAWTVGHLACVFDLFTSWIRGSGCHLAKEIHDVFNGLDVRAAGGPSKAEIVEKSGHRKSDILFMLRTTQIRALKLLSTCTERDLQAAPPGPHPDNLHTVGEIWEHLAVHTYWHMGELCGTFSRFHGTYTLNMLPHYFYYLPGERDREQ